MLRRLTNLSPVGGRAPVAAAALVYGLRFRATNETATVKSLDQRVRALEATKSLDGLLEFYGSRSHAKFDIGTVVRRCVDPDYNTHIFCHKELPLFLAHHVRAIDCLPIGLHAMHSILDIRRHLADSFEKLIHCPLPICATRQKEFLDVVRKVHDERQDLDILRKMAMGVLELKEHLSRHTRARLTSSNQTMSHQAIYEKLLPEMRKLQDPLDECNRYFIYYSFLASQLMNLEGQDLRSSARIGTIDREIDLVNLVRGAVDDAKDICNSVYGDCPDVEIIVPESEPTTFAHKGSTIHYILLELMKNALRATVESHMTRNEAGFVNCDDMPPVRVVVMSSSNLQHSCVCIEDEGRGIPRQRMDLVMSYTYTTASKPALALLEAVDPNANHSSSTEVDMSPLAGYGFGLPVSRMYARCFGGDLTLSSMEGFGTKASLFIKSIASHETTS